jgi:hypothetical protein
MGGAWMVSTTSVGLKTLPRYMRRRAASCENMFVRKHANCQTVWHAKRIKMVDLCGWRLPLKDKKKLSPNV